MPPPTRRAAAGLLAAVVLCAPAAARAQTSTIPEDGAGVTTTPPVPLGEPEEGTGTGAASGEAGGSRERSTASELPDTGSDPRIAFLAGLALTLLGVGLRLRTADADDY